MRLSDHGRGLNHNDEVRFEMLELEQRGTSATGSGTSNQKHRPSANRHLMEPARVPLL